MGAWLHGACMHVHETASVTVGTPHSAAGTQEEWRDALEEGEERLLSCAGPLPPALRRVVRPPAATPHFSRQVPLPFEGVVIWLAPEALMLLQLILSALFPLYLRAYPGDPGVGHQYS
jgi:hypothetical protein